MQTLEKGFIIGANRYQVRNQRGGSLYMVQQNSGINDQLIGLEVKRIDMPFHMFNQLKPKNLPGEYEVIVDSTRGGADEAKLMASSIKCISENDLTFVDRFSSLFSMLPIDKALKDRTLKPSFCYAFVLSASCYQMEEEGISGGRIYLAQMSTGINSNQVGMEIIKLRMPFELFDEFKAKGLPGEYLVALHLDRAARDKARYRVVSIESDNLLDVSRFSLLTGLTLKTSHNQRIDSVNPSVSKVS